MPTAATSISRTDTAASRLRTDILSGDAEPGALLAESSMAQRLGVSRIPVREALFTLEREGLVEFNATGRAFVKELTRRDFEELFELRLTLEPAAARLAAAQIKQDASRLEKNLAATRRAKSAHEVTRLDLEFHEVILAASGNARLLKLWRSLRCELELWLGRLHRTHLLRTRETLQETVEAHAAVVECFQKRTPAACERLMRKHIQGWREWLPAM